MIFLSGDVVAVLGFIFFIACIASLFITIVLKLIFKDKLTLYQYFLIALILLIILFFLFIKFSDFFF